MQWSDIIIMYLGVLYFWNIQWWFRLQFPFFSVYFARCKLSYISLSLSGWSHLWFFNGFCLPNDQKGAINANCNRNQSFAPINPNILSRFLSACLPVCFSFSFVRLLMWFTICQSSHPTRKAFNSLSMDFKTHYNTLRHCKDWGGGGILTPSG